MNMAAILAQVFSPATRMQCPKMGNEFQCNSFGLRRLPLWSEKIDGQSQADLDYREGVFPYILISLIFISVSCRLLFEYTLFTIGKLIMCRTAADFESSMMVSRMASIFSNCYDL